MGNIFLSSCRSCCDKYEGLDETNTKNDERSSVDGNQPIESTEYTNLVTMTAKFVYIDRPRDLTTVDRFIVKKNLYELHELDTLAKLKMLFTIYRHYHDR